MLTFILSSVEDGSKLIYAVKTGNIDTVKLLLDKGADVNVKDSNDYLAESCFDVCGKQWSDRGSKTA